MEQNTKRRRTTSFVFTMVWMLYLASGIAILSQLYPTKKEATKASSRVTQSSIFYSGLGKDYN
jgi:hypothetical protein